MRRWHLHQPLSDAVLHGRRKRYSVIDQSAYVTYVQYDSGPQQLSHVFSWWKTWPHRSSHLGQAWWLRHGSYVGEPPILELWNKQKKVAKQLSSSFQFSERSSTIWCWAVFKMSTVFPWYCVVEVLIIGQFILTKKTSSITKQSKSLCKSQINTIISQLLDSCTTL